MYTTFRYTFFYVVHNPICVFSISQQPYTFLPIFPHFFVKCSSTRPSTSVSAFDAFPFLAIAFVALKENADDALVFRAGA